MSRKGCKNRIDKGVYLVCEVCSEPFRVRAYRKNTARFCSRSCKSKQLYIEKALPSGFTRKGYVPWNKNKNTGITPKSVFKKGQNPWNKGLSKYNDEMLRLRHNISCAISRSLKTNKKGRRWEKIVNYSLQDLKKHLEKQFTEGMNWDNYGEWHVDHKIPVSVFNFKTVHDIDFKKCWRLKNLQPMWGKDNISKGNLLSTPFQPAFAFGA